MYTIKTDQCPAAHTHSDTDIPIMDQSMQPILYRPQGDLESLQELFDRVPRYLFRTSTRNSNGHTSSVRVKSAAAVNNRSTKDVFERNVTSARNMLKFHVLWKDYSDDNFTSWTSSIVFALQHGIRKAIGGRYHSAEEPSTIDIMILDTRKVPRGAFLPSMALLKAYNLTKDPDIVDKLPYYYGEYLSQGVLDFTAGSTVATTLAKLNELGLGGLYSPSTHKIQANHLWLAVNGVRTAIKNEQEREPTSEELRLAQRIALGITGSKNFLPVVMMLLLSTKPRYRLSPAILKAFEMNRWGEWYSCIWTNTS